MCKDFSWLSIGQLRVDFGSAVTLNFHCCLLCTLFGIIVAGLHINMTHGFVPFMFVNQPQLSLWWSQVLVLIPITGFNFNVDALRIKISL